MLCYSGFYGYGVKEVWDMIFEYMRFVKDNGYFNYRRHQQNKYWMYETIEASLRNSFYHNPIISQRLHDVEAMVQNGEKTSFMAAHALLDEYFKNLR